MNRFLQRFNLLGVLALVALCCLQWRANQQMNLQTIQLETRELEQAKTITGHEETIQGQAADLDELRRHLEQTEAQLKLAEGREADAKDQQDEFSAKSAAFKENLDQWKSTAAARDEAIKKAGEQMQLLAAQRDAAVAKYNDLATQYNSAAQQLKQGAEIIQSLAAQRNEAVEKFNALAEKYNASLDAANQAATKP